MAPSPPASTASTSSPVSAPRSGPLYEPGSQLVDGGGVPASSLGGCGLGTSASGICATCGGAGGVLVSGAGALGGSVAATCASASDGMLGPGAAACTPASLLVAL